MGENIAQDFDACYRSGMPELPEVETVRRGLEIAMAGQTLIKVLQRRPDLRRPFPPFFAERLTGRRIVALRRRAKYLTIDLDDGNVLLIHLGMSGRMLVGPVTGAPFDKHDHVVFDIANGQRVIFNDPRRFGVMDLFPAEQAHPLLSHLGPEPLDESFNAKSLAARIKDKISPIKVVLLDQTVVAGIGNIYASEALFRAGIAPDRAACDVKKKEIERLVPAVKQVLEEAIAAGGSSLKDHRQTNGELGYFQHSFKVYDREGLPCPDCGCKEGIRRMTQAGRSTFYCASKQR
jgi:formamidopyrimidine-DNA glycosylase